MKNLFLLPTDKPSMLWFNDLIDNNELILSLTEVETVNNQNIYITSDEEIKEGDWVLGGLGGIDIKKYGRYFAEDWKKIILTTDPDLIADGVQAIDDEFLEWFIKNPSCKLVEVSHQLHKDEPLYKIIIPQEEPNPFELPKALPDDVFYQSLEAKQETFKSE